VYNIQTHRVLTTHKVGIICKFGQCHGCSNVANQFPNILKDSVHQLLTVSFPNVTCHPCGPCMQLGCLSTMLMHKPSRIDAQSFMPIHYILLVIFPSALLIPLFHAIHGEGKCFLSCLLSKQSPPVYIEVHMYPLSSSKQCWSNIHCIHSPL
jgi:hypothetical protein